MYILFTIQPTSLLDHHPVSPFLDTPVTSHLMFPNRAISITSFFKFSALWHVQTSDGSTSPGFELLP